MVTDADNHPLLLVDMLPAGLEVESFVLSGKEFRWLDKPVQARVREKRDDRVVVAFDRYPGHGDYDPEENTRDNGKIFTVAYVARAVTLGDYILPGGQVEDMYRPQILATTAAGRISILDAQAMKKLQAKEESKKEE
jgi:uncharacterized protein YfaS (alpha-2-macroglobulin family)